MTIAEQLKQIRDTFAPWVKAFSGHLEISNDPVHTFAILQSKPGTPCVVVQFENESKRGEIEEVGMYDRTFHIIIYRSHGMKLEKGDALIEGTSGGRALYDLIEEARELVRRISFDGQTTETTPDFKRIAPYVFQDTTFDAALIEFSIGCQLPAVDLKRNPSQPNPETLP